MTHERVDDLKAVYDQLCVSYRAIDDTRSKLLGLLPLATGAGIFVLSDKAGPISGLSAAVGLFGFLATIGLFSYELHGIKKCATLIDAGGLIERKLGIYGQFLRRPREAAGFIDEPFAASIIYPASLAGWMFLALVDLPRWVAYLAASVVFLVGFRFSWWLIGAMESDVANRRVYCREPKWFPRVSPQGSSEPLPGDAYILWTPPGSKSFATGDVEAEPK